MSKQTGIVTLDIGYTNLEDDLNTALAFRDNGDQDFLETVNNYIQILKRAVASFELIKDTISSEEANKLELVTNTNSTLLCVKGDSEIIERFVGFGIASEGDSENDEDDNSDSDSDNDEDTDSDYNELCASDDTDTPIGSDDEELEEYVEPEHVEEIKPKKVPRK